MQANTLVRAARLHVGGGARDGGGIEIFSEGGDLLATGNRLGLVMTEALLMGRCEGGKKGRNWLPT